MTSQYRVHGITVAQRPGGDYGVTLDLNSIQLESALRVQQQLGKSTANSSGGRSTYLSGLPLLAGNVEAPGSGGGGGGGTSTQIAARLSGSGWTPPVGSGSKPFKLAGLSQVDWDPNNLAVVDGNALLGTLYVIKASTTGLWSVDVFVDFITPGAVQPKISLASFPGLPPGEFDLPVGGTDFVTSLLLDTQVYPGGQEVGFTRGGLVGANANDYLAVYVLAQGAGTFRLVADFALVGPAVAISTPTQPPTLLCNGEGGIDANDPQVFYSTSGFIYPCWWFRGPGGAAVGGPIGGDPPSIFTTLGLNGTTGSEGWAFSSPNASWPRNLGWPASSANPNPANSGLPTGLSIPPDAAGVRIQFDYDLQGNVQAQGVVDPGFNDSTFNYDLLLTIDLISGNDAFLGAGMGYQASPNQSIATVLSVAGSIHSAGSRSFNHFQGLFFTTGWTTASYEVSSSGLFVPLALRFVCGGTGASVSPPLGGQNPAISIRIANVKLAWL